MFILAYRSRNAANAPLQVNNPMIVYDNHRAASEAAAASAKVNTSSDYFVLEGTEKHSACITVNVSKP